MNFGKKLVFPSEISRKKIYELDIKDTDEIIEVRIFL